MFSCFKSSKNFLNTSQGLLGEKDKSEERRGKGSVYLLEEEKLIH